MKLTPNKWNIAYEGQNKQLTYYGYKTKKDAQKFVDNWNASHEEKIQVIKVG